MIEDLTIEKLIEYGFSDENVDHFKSWDNYEMMFYNGSEGTYWASNNEKKIYSGKDALRKKYFSSEIIVSFPSDEPDLIPEYYERKRSVFLKKNKEAVGKIFIEAKSKERFRQKEIELTMKEIKAARSEIESQHIQVLKQSALKHCNLMENYLDWLIELNEFEHANTPRTLEKIEETELPLKLDMFFESNSKYELIMALLVSKNHCQSGTYIWKDEKKGNKTVLAAILKHLHHQQYYKNNTKLTNDQIQKIAQNTFGLSISIDTIKRATSENADVSFIPKASDLNQV